MSLLPGSRLGPYEIKEPLGAGGMGEATLSGYFFSVARDGRFLAVVPVEQPGGASELRLVFN